jgi:hypothetical protein
VITAGCVEHLNHKAGFPVEDISTIHVTFVGHEETGADFLTISLHDDNANIELEMIRYGHLKFHEVKDVPVQLVEDELELFLSRFEESFGAPRVPEPFPPVPGVPEYIIQIDLKNNTRYRIDQLCGGPIRISDKANGTSFCIARHSIDYFTPLRDLSAKVFELDPTLEDDMFKESPSLLGSEIAKIEAHNGHDVDHLYIHIIDGEAELKIGVDDENKYIYQSAKKVPVEQILDELNSFTELFNRRMTAEHVEMPLERSMSSDYQIAIYLADGRHYLIAQVIDAPIQVENKTGKHHLMFYLKPYSIDYTQPIKNIGTKAFDLQPSIQEKFFGPSTTELQKPEWGVGDWWMVEVSQRADHIAVSYPPWFAPIKWRFEVTDVRSVDGEECFVVEVSNLGEKAVLYHRTGDLSLIEHSWSYAGYPIMPFTVPVFPAKMAAIPFDIPGIPNANTTVDYTKVTHDKADAKCYKVDIGYGYQLWHPNAPYWLYYEKAMIKARLVDCSWWHE